MIKATTIPRIKESESGSASLRGCLMYLIKPSWYRVHSFPLVSGFFNQLLLSKFLSLYDYSFIFLFTNLFCACQARFGAALERVPLSVLWPRLYCYISVAVNSSFAVVAHIYAQTTRTVTPVVPHMTSMLVISQQQSLMIITDVCVCGPLAAPQLGRPPTTSLSIIRAISRCATIVGVICILFDYYQHFLCVLSFLSRFSIRFRCHTHSHIHTVHTYINSQNESQLTFVYTGTIIRCLSLFAIAFGRGPSRRISSPLGAFFHKAHALQFAFTSISGIWGNCVCINYCCCYYYAFIVVFVTHLLLFLYAFIVVVIAHTF